MLLGTGLLAVGGLMVWTGVVGTNGFVELAKLIRGEEAFRRVPPNVAGAGGSLTGSGEAPPAGGGGGGGGAW